MDETNDERMKGNKDGIEEKRYVETRRLFHSVLLFFLRSKTDFSAAEIDKVCLKLW
jgi:hypothetical protein